MFPGSESSLAVTTVVAREPTLTSGTNSSSRLKSRVRDTWRVRVSPCFNCWGSKEAVMFTSPNLLRVAATVRTDGPPSVELGLDAGVADKTGVGDTLNPL